MSDKPTLYGIWLSGPTYKVALALSLLGRSYSYVHVNLRGGEQKTPEFVALNRFGQVPVLKIDGLALCQSTAILEYLAASSGKFGGSTPVVVAKAREWLFWAADKLNANIYRSRAAALGFRSFPADVLAMYADEGKAALGALDAHLAQSEWLAGSEPTIADIDIYCVLHYAPAGGFDLAAYPAIIAWTKRFEALPGFGLPEAVMPQETKL